MAKANKYFIKRGEVTESITFRDEILDITIERPNNYENDTMIERHTETGLDGQVEIKAADLMEEMLVTHIINLPFEVPVDDTFENFKQWSELDMKEKTNAIRVMDEELRDIIFKTIESKTHLTSKDMSN